VPVDPQGALKAAPHGRALARTATAIENGTSEGLAYLAGIAEGDGLVVGITGPPGAGKSTLVDALTSEIRRRGKTVGILAVDPTSRMTGGAILGDRVRMQKHHGDAGVFIRSMATRGAGGGLARATKDLARLLRGAGFDYILIETVGVGQDEIDIAGLADVTVLVLTSGMGDDVQAIKAGIMEIASIYVINKADLAGAGRTEQEIRAEVGGAPILRTVATEGTGIPELLDAIDAATRRQPLAADAAGRAVQSLEDALRSFEDALAMKPGSMTVDHLAVRAAGYDGANSASVGGVELRIVK
jgi:LAO/AO transport system kinase